MLAADEEARDFRYWHFAALSGKSALKEERTWLSAILLGVETDRRVPKEGSHSAKPGWGSVLPPLATLPNVRHTLPQKGLTGRLHAARRRITRHDSPKGLVGQHSLGCARLLALRCCNKKSAIPLLENSNTIALNSTSYKLQTVV
jgi:hypothetical protein